MNLELLKATCPVCAHTVATHFFDAGKHTLATLAWPASSDAARVLPTHPLDYVQCPKCSHVWNRAFRYEAIPYQNNPNRMFNKGGVWQGHLATIRDSLLVRLPPHPVVIEIGCGEGHFIRGLAEASNSGRFVGFDPNTSPQTGLGVEFYARLFEPLVDIRNFAPDAVVIRHVLEHLTDPSALLEQLAWGAAHNGKPVWLFAEVPCIDRVFETDRLADFFYEHVSQFTTQSFLTLMERAGEVVTLAHGYDSEVVYALVKLTIPTEILQRAETANDFAQRAIISRRTIQEQLSELASSGKRVAIWGGTGKAAAFIHFFGADAERFPLVVDSDPEKVGTYVPGTGQRIAFRDELKTTPASVVIIPTQWRAQDIISEMEREGITATTILIEHKGRLIDYWAERHPYRAG